MTGPETGDLIISAVVATLRQVAGWGLSFEDGPAQQELLEIARQVELLAAQDILCCPVCEEVECDDDCPLAAIGRGLAG